MCFLYNSTCRQQAHGALGETLLPPDQRHHLRRRRRRRLCQQAASFDFFSCCIDVTYKAKYFDKNHQNVAKKNLNRGQIKKKSIARYYIPVNHAQRKFNMISLFHVLWNSEYLSTQKRVGVQSWQQLFKSSNTDTLVPLHSVAAASIDFRRKTSHFHRYGKYQFSKLSIFFINFQMTSNPNIEEIK